MFREIFRTTLSCTVMLTVLAASAGAADALKMSCNVTASGNSYVYYYLTGIANYTIQSGDYLEYDVLWMDSDTRLAVDFACTDATVLRGTAVTDQNGIGMHPANDLYAYAFMKWYHRKANISSLAGKVINGYLMACESDTTAVKRGFLKNIVVTDGASTTRKVIYTGGAVTHTVGYTNSASLQYLGRVVQTTITSPASAAGNTYNTQPWVIINANDGTYTVNDCRVIVDASNPITAGYNYDSYASRDGTYARFYPLGTGANLTIRHRLSSALGAGTYYVSAQAWTNNVSGVGTSGAEREGAPSDLVQITISAASWTDPTITAGSTLIKASHFTELRTAINNTRRFRGYGNYAWTNGTLSAGASLIKVADMNEMRTALTGPYNAATGSDPAFTDTINSSQLIRKVHIDELRSKTASYP